METTDVIARISVPVLRPMFYTKRGFPRQRLVNKYQILAEAGVDTEGFNLLEWKGLEQLLHKNIHRIKQEAQAHGLNWISIRVETGHGSLVHYGFCTDIAKIDECIERFSDIARWYRESARKARQLGTAQRRLLEAAG